MEGTGFGRSFSFPGGTPAGRAQAPVLVDLWFEAVYNSTVRGTATAGAGVCTGMRLPRSGAAWLRRGRSGCGARRMAAHGPGDDRVREYGCSGVEGGAGLGDGADRAGEGWFGPQGRRHDRGGDEGPSGFRGGGGAGSRVDAVRGEPGAGTGGQGPRGRARPGGVASDRASPEEQSAQGGGAVRSDPFDRLVAARSCVVRGGAAVRAGDRRAGPGEHVRRAAEGRLLVGRGGGCGGRDRVPAGPPGVRTHDDGAVHVRRERAPADVRGRPGAVRTVRIGGAGLRAAPPVDGNVQ